MTIYRTDRVYSHTTLGQHVADILFGRPEVRAEKERTAAPEANPTTPKPVRRVPNILRLDQKPQPLRYFPSIKPATPPPAQVAPNRFVPEISTLGRPQIVDGAWPIYAIGLGLMLLAPDFEEWLRTPPTGDYKPTPEEGIDNYLARVREEMERALDLGMKEAELRQLVVSGQGDSGRAHILKQELSELQSTTIGSTENGIAGSTRMPVITNSTNSDAAPAIPPAGADKATSTRNSWERQKQHLGTFFLDNSLSLYDNVMLLNSPMGRLSDAVQRRIDRGQTPVKMLELGAGYGVAAHKLKELFDGNIIIDNLAYENEVTPENVSAFRNQRFADIDTVSPWDTYDFVISFFGGPFYAQNIDHAIQLMAESLAVGGEAFVFLSNHLSLTYSCRVLQHLGALFMAGTRARGLEIFPQLIQIYFDSIHYVHYFRRISAEAQFHEALSNGLLVQQQVLTRVGQPFGGDLRGLYKLPHAERGAMLQQAADAFASESGIPLSFGFREFADGPIRTDWDQLPALLQPHRDQVIAEFENSFSYMPIPKRVDDAMRRVYDDILSGVPVDVALQRLHAFYK